MPSYKPDLSYRLQRYYFESKAFTRNTLLWLINTNKQMDIIDIIKYIHLEHFLCQ